MAGLGKGHTYDNWHPTRKYFPSPGKEIDFGLETYQELQQAALDDYFYSFEERELAVINWFLEGNNYHVLPTLSAASTNPHH
jgi:hypothetical protein